MPRFTNAPPSDPRGQPLPLRRCPFHRPLTAIVTCHDVVGCPTHYWGGRTVPCEEQDCEPCLAGVRWNWHGYVSAYDLNLKLHFLFEVTARCSEAFTDYRKANPTLRGCHFEATRPSGKSNGRVYLRTKTADLQKTAVPDAPNIPDVLAMIWNITPAEISEAPQIKGAPAIKVNSNGNGRDWQPEVTSDEARTV